MSTAYLRDLESRAISGLISLAPADGDISPENHGRVRRLCATSLRAWRRGGNRNRARYFRNEMSRMGYPFKPGETAEHLRSRRAAFIRRVWPKHGWNIPAWAQLNDSAAS